MSLTMNLPNKLTVFRVLLIPLFLLLFYLDLPYGYLGAAVVFGVASFTDFLDGQIARSRGLVTDFGKFMDPLADKLLVTAAMLCLMDAGFVPSIAVILVVSREFIVTSLRLLAAPQGLVIAADRWGKYKTVSQMVWILVALLEIFVITLGIPTSVQIDLMFSINSVLVWLMVALTVLSGINYLYKNRGILRDM